MAVDGGVTTGVVAGRYRLLRVVGTGGMSQVWLARDEVLARDVAVKEMLAIPGLHADVWQRTIREARAAARLNHPNVVRVYDVLFTDGRPWLIMEFVTGRALDAAVRDDGPLDPPAAARLGLDVLAGLDAAHRAGVLHRDVKPANVLLADDGRVLLGDFGVAAFDEGGATRDDVLLASPAYVAPERLSDGVSSVETDLWSFGATLFWAVEGRPPYDRGTSAEQLAALAAEAPDRARRAGALTPVIEGLLRRRPAERSGVEATRTRLLAASVPARRRGARRNAVVGAAAAVLVAAGAAGAYASRPSTVAPVVPRPVAAPAAPVLPCGFPPSGPATGVGGGASGPSALPAGWVWHVEDLFRVGVPGAWGRTTGSGVICLTDAAGRRAVTVATAPPEPDRVAYWQHEEDRLLAAPPQGYHRVAISPVIYQRGAADWEFTFDDAGVRWHVLRRDFAAADGRGFIVSWTTRDDEWDVEQPTFRTLTQTFEVR